MDELLTTGEAARLLGKAPRTIRGYIARGLLPVARRGDVERLRGAPAPPSPRTPPLPA